MKISEEIQRYQDYEMSGCFPLADGDYVKYEDHAKALSAERERAEKRVESNRLYGYRDGMKESDEKIKALESKLKETKFYVYEGSDNEADLLNKQHQQITALEAKVKELETRNLELGERTRKAEVVAIDLESKLTTANAKIVELEKRNKELESQQGETMMLGGANIALNKRIDDLEANLSTANKKAEKLVEALEPFMGRLEGWRKMLDDKTIVEPISAEWLAVEQAIKEFKP